MVKTIDNVNNTLQNDLKLSIRKGSKVSVASACFSIYAFKELKEELKSIDSLKFIFTSPTFVQEKESKERREFYIPRLSRERSIYGTEFEVRLRNELSQKAIARECAEWVKKKVEFRTNVTNECMNSFINVTNDDEKVSYTPINGFTTAGLGCERGNNLSNMVVKMENSETKEFFKTFDEIWNDKSKMSDVKDQVLDSITAAYVENSPDLIYFITLYNIFSAFLEDISADYLPNEGVGFKDSKIWNMLYSFQKDAALGIISKLEKYNGCILADSVGLGKTFTALAVIKYYECRNKDVLVLCPKRLSENWNTYRNLYKDNILIDDKFGYTVLYHTDLSRSRGQSNGVDLGRIVWGNFGLVVIDESHNFRNGGDTSNDERENRYDRLLKDVIRSGVQTKVLMLSATPVNNRFYDLLNQLKIAYEGNPQLMENNLNISHSLEDVFKNAQRVFNKWNDLPPAEKSTDALLSMLDFDFFEVLDSVTIARSRRHIEKYYSLNDIGKFPTRLPPISKSPGITDLDGAISYEEINTILSQQLNLAIYIPTDFLLPSKASKYVSNENINRRGREMGIRRLMSVSLLKRLESSIYAFRITLKKVLSRIELTLNVIENHKNKNVKLQVTDFSPSDFDDEYDIEETFALGKKFEIDLDDLDYEAWKAYLEEDRVVLENLIQSISVITPEHDSKLKELLSLILDKVNHPINGNNSKILIFSAFTDTADYLYDNISGVLKHTHGLNVAEVTGNSSKSTIQKLQCNYNDVLTCFSPVSKNKKTLLPNISEDIDVLIGTDCISEGQNLQDCDYCVNYDIHWNPVRIIQRFGRIDRIGSTNDVIQLVNFWPDINLDDYINLKERVESRMKLSIMTTTGDDNPINSEEKGDLEYRAQQLKRLKKEVVDIEEMQTGISIVDLGLNEFRLDLLDYTKEHGDLDMCPFGLHAVVPASPDIPRGVIFVLKNINNNVNKDNQNRLHPFYMVYVLDSGNIYCDHLSPKKVLDLMRFSCKDKTEPDKGLCKEFNVETNDGKNMKHISELLQSTIGSIIDVKQQSDLDDFLSGGNVSFRDTKISGLDDFELICFLVVR